MKTIGNGMLGALQTITNSPESGFRNHSVDACHKRALQNLPVLPELIAQSLLKTVEFILALSMIISYQSKSRVYPNWQDQLALSWSHLWLQHICLPKHLQKCSSWGICSNLPHSSFLTLNTVLKKTSNNNKLLFLDWTGFNSFPLFSFQSYLFFQILPILLWCNSKE